jgi:hypothetical protein
MREPEPAMELHQRWPDGLRAWGEEGSQAALRSGTRRGRASRHPGSRRLLITAIAVGLAYAVSVLGVVSDNGDLAAYGLGASAPAAFAMATVAWTSLRRLERRCELLGRARAESERARHDLEVENAELERRNAELKSEQLAILEDFDWIDERTNGRLSDLVQEAGDELAEFADEVLDDPAEDA